jgi:hypothetical protein
MGAVLPKFTVIHFAPSLIQVIVWFAESGTAFAVQGA